MKIKYMSWHGATFQCSLIDSELRNVGVNTAFNGSMLKSNLIYI